MSQPLCLMLLKLPVNSIVILVSTAVVPLRAIIPVSSLSTLFMTLLLHLFVLEHAAYLLHEFAGCRVLVDLR